MRQSTTMTKRFVEFMPFIFKWEGGYDNDPDDPGGETKYGIDKRSHPEVGIKELTREAATEIYWNDYWLKNGCDDYPFAFGEVFFNACVNCGSSRAMRILRATQEGECALAFLEEQEGFYRRLVGTRPPLRRYLKGWLNRTHDLKVFLRLG